MRELLADVRYEAWTATALAATLAAVCSLLHLALPAVLAAMAAGLILMWISEEANRVVAAMAPGDAPLPAPALAAPALAPEPAPAPAPEAARKPAPESVAPEPARAPEPAMPGLRAWVNPFPASRPAVGRQRPQQGRRARR